MHRRISSLLLIFIAGVMLVRAEEPPDDLREHLQDLEATAIDIRELEPLADVERRFPTRAEALDFLEGEIDRQLTDSVVLQDTQFYRAFDFVGPEFDLVPTFLDLLGEQVGGYYDPETDTMNVLLITPGADLTAPLPALERITYVHEYIHALQDQHFDLAAFLDEVEEPDAILARTTLVEGDATLVMQDFTFQLAMNDPDAIQELGALTATGFGALPDDVPPVLLAELTMPYLQGLSFVLAIRRDGGWSAVDAAFDDPPVSTEQVLHPEKYLAGEMPVAVELTTTVAPGDDWELLFERTLGEFYLRQFLRTRLDDDIAEEAAAGWGGDRYQLYYNGETDERAWVLRLTWDSPDDADEFDAAIHDLGQIRLGARDDTCYSDEDEALCIVRTEDGHWVAFAPAASIARTMIAEQG